MEKHKRTKLQPKVERTIYLGMSPNHSNDTYKLMKISNQEIIYRRNVYFNERSFPARKFQLPPTLTAVDTGADLIGADFDDEGSRWTVLKTGEYEGTPVLYYKHKDNGTEECSSVAEVRTWVNQTTLHQATNTLKPTRKGYINTLAEESFKAITTTTSNSHLTLQNPLASKRLVINLYHNGLELRLKNGTASWILKPGSAFHKLTSRRKFANALYDATICTT